MYVNKSQTERVKHTPTCYGIHDCYICVACKAYMPNGHITFGIYCMLQMKHACQCRTYEM